MDGKKQYIRAIFAVGFACLVAGVLIGGIIERLTSRKRIKLPTIPLTETRISLEGRGWAETVMIDIKGSVYRIAPIADGNHAVYVITQGAKP